MTPIAQDLSYFIRHYSALTFPLADENDNGGFRVAQAGALHAIAAHFSRSTEPAIVTMPTGSGKTAVLMGTGFLLRSRRVLVVTPSRLVREQIGEQFAELSVLRRIGAIGHIPSPKVLVVKEKPKVLADWERMRGFDVVVATPSAISPALAGVVFPPNDLFDLVLVDEAHHSPAHSWQELLDGFPTAKRALFTATPFRRDRREIRGRFVYTYELSAAYDDKVFGKIRFVPVRRTGSIGNDQAIAIAASKTLLDDRASGRNHLIMVRVDSQQRAKELESVYAQTGLRLPVLTSNHSLKHAKKIIDQLRQGKLDGLICVNMLGEGFDLPALKVAAIHSPHKSLAATLQFIGRFARTGDATVGDATFHAIPSEIEIASEQLYQEDAAWQTIVTNLSATAIADEVETRDILETFAPQDGHLKANYEVSLYAIRPGYHAKVFRTEGNADLESPIAFDKGVEVVFREFSREQDSAILVTRQIASPDWLLSGQFADVVHELFVVHLHRPSGLLFICASERTEGTYDRIAKQVAEKYWPISMPRLSRVLLQLNNPEFFNIGLRNRVQASGTESYRIMAGPGVDQAVTVSDGRLYSQGHVFGRGKDKGVSVTLGLSSSSRVWSSTKSRIPRLIEWCDRLAAHINSETVVRTNSGLDRVTPGEELVSIPADVVSVDWDVDAYSDPPRVVRAFGSAVTDATILDFAAEIDVANTSTHSVRVVLEHSNRQFSVDYSLAGNDYFKKADNGDHDVTLERGGQQLTLVEYLNANPLRFYTSDLSFFSGSTFVRAAEDGFQPFDASSIEAVDWMVEGVDFTTEFDVPAKGKPRAGLMSIHTFLERRLQGEGADIVFYDHGTGEVADFVVVRKDPSTPFVRISLYHCKSSPIVGGDRVSDTYEVVGQCVKSVHWRNLPALRDKIRHRSTSRPGESRFVRGSLADLERLLADSQRMYAHFEAVIVQPGFARSALSPKLGNLLAAGGDYLSSAAFQPLRVLGSA